MPKTFLLLAFTCSLLACHKNDCCPANSVEQIVFGVSYAECAGNCSDNYRLTTTQIFADTCDYCEWYSVGFQTTPLDDAKFQIAQPLLASVPAVLLTEEETVFGCPGCADEGGWYLKITQHGKKHLYRWSSSFDLVPNKLRPYFEKVMQTQLAL